MAIASGLGSQFALSKETVYGTVVTPAKFYEFDQDSMAWDPTYQEAVGLRASRTFQPSGRTKLTTRQAAGASPMDVPNKLFGSILDLMHGLTPTVVQQGATAAWLQTHNIGTSQPNKSATLQVNKPLAAGTDYPVTYPGSVLVSVAFSMDTGGTLKCTPTWDSQDELTPDTTPTGPSLATPSYPAGLSSWDHTQAIITLNGTPSGQVRSANWTWTQPYKTDRFFLGATTKAKPIPNGFATVEGTLEIEWFNTAAYLLYRSAAKVALLLDFQGPIIASTFKEQITFTMSAIQVRGQSPNVDGPDVLDTSVAFKALDDGTNPPLVIAYMATDVAI